MSFQNNQRLPSMLHPWLNPPDPPNEDLLMQDNQADVKGEYIEDCDAIKEETQDLSDQSKQVPAQHMPHYSHYYPVPNSNYSSNMPTIQQNPSQQNLTPLQLIQQLSTYAVTGNKRKEASTSKSPGSKKKKLQDHSQHPVMTNTSQQSLPDTSVGGNTSQNSSVTVVGEPSTNNNKSSTKTVTTDDIPCPVPRSMIDCPVCGDTAVAHFHYGGMCCYSCKAFFRRVVNTNKVGS